MKDPHFSPKLHYNPTPHHTGLGFIGTHASLGLTYPFSYTYIDFVELDKVKKCGIGVAYKVAIDGFWG